MSDTTGSNRLLVREWTDGSWSSEEVVAEGTNWFVNWADFPSVKPLGADRFYHYLSYSGVGTYDYDVHFGVGHSKEASSQVLHNDSIPAEHGFVSSAHRPDGSLQVSWLDGRYTKQGGELSTSGHDHGSSAGAMTLRTAVVDSDGVVSERRELDHRVCDCCSTATAIVGGRALVVYRDRSETEIRDMAFVREREDGSWSEPQPVNQDNWHIAGCPVNGPALAANESGDAATAWYTAADDRPRIMFARYDSVDGEFGPAIILDDDNPAGRVDVKVVKDGLAYVLGLGRSGEGDVGDLKLWSVKASNEVSVRTVGAMSTARSSGFPRLAIDGDDV
ncbi:MAG: hypothetical protein WA952_20510, partial [Lewinella sp.]